ncbi:MAG: 16S rRNA (cytidine(1402)-2'-O)-methyltransferase [candidate division KSB1 bacterium]|nr:16S rRNA (cytidine(1402)-2'-O)-methyltransferase [candidate division KSB1 bacterium]MDZ7346049.1 16S rRNA (cytidine(1402)-2'-O)-methyltransferase [candidate division KSB1 bacterium]
MNEEKTSVKPGTLYVVSTPIGNLRDITLRALDVLAQVDVIAAEDTRTSRVLLEHYQIRRPLIAHHEFNEEKSALQIVRRLKERQSVAVITDAGTPGISDPAYVVIREAIKHDIPVCAVPGATAFVPALLLSGLPLDRFVFEGFLPAKKGRRTRLQELAQERRTMIFYEAPHRIMKTLQELLEVFGDRRAAVMRELTKKFEQIYRGTLSQAIAALAQWTIKGEFVIVVAGLNDAEKRKRSDAERTYELY